MRFIPLILLLSLAACVQTPPGTEQARYTPTSFAALPGWAADDLTQALPALSSSCARLRAIPPDRSLGADGKMGRAGDWLPFCAALSNARSTAELRSVIQSHLTPYAVSWGESSTGLFTGYYESELRGSRTRHNAYQVPLYSRPADLVMVDLGEFRDSLKGQRIAGRVVGGQLKPYADRAKIVNGALDGQNLELIWLDNKVDAFFVQIQGSGRVKMDDGSELRVGYAGQNGHPYTAIGRELIARGELAKENVSMQSIRAWLDAHPAQADALMNSNPSYVFFKLLENEAGPLGAANVALTPLRSLAVDNRYIGYHVPLWLATDQPALQRLMVAQDTGGAITGAVRGDVFWGHGPQAEQQAGLMKSTGRYYVLLPKSLPAP